MSPSMVFAIGLIGLGLVYATIVSTWAFGFARELRRSRTSQPVNGHAPLVSIIVPARDEAATIGACLDAILANDYPSELFEVIVVDDLSRDATPEVVRDRIRRLEAAGVPALAGVEDEASPETERLRLIQMPSHLERARAHKKRAITMGIESARGAIILSTDADCVVPPTWVRTMVAAFDDDVALVSGPVLYRTGSVRADVQALEFLGLVSVGAGAIGAGAPNLCNGANVAYRRDVFLAVGGFSGIDHLTSGDDELLMQRIAYETDWRVNFCADPDAAVVTDGAPSLGAFFQQRKRWASKGRHYPHLPLRITISAIFAFYVILLALPIMLALGTVATPAALAAIALKVVPESVLLGMASHHFGRARLMAYFLPLQPLHVAYIVTMGLAGAIGGYRWKDRRVER